MAEAASPAVHWTFAHIKNASLNIPQGAVSRKPRLRSYVGRNKGITYPLANYQMWRGNHWAYRYNQATASVWGEGETNKQYHQHYAHAKDVTDYGRGGREFEFLSVKKGSLQLKPLPKVQYVPAGATPKWLWKSWHGAMNASDMWQREVVYDNHVPEHLDCKRPLAVLAPSTYHAHLHLMHMEKVTITVSPFLFGFGDTVQKVVMDFYRRALGARSPFPKDKIFLFYAIDFITPKVEVTWLDGTTFSPPILEGSSAQSLIQIIMEQGWLAQDRMEAAGRTLQPLAIDDYKWEQLITFKKIRDKDAVKGGKKK
jgi:hypothetical protein